MSRLLALLATAFIMLWSGLIAAQPLMFLPFPNGETVRCVQGNNGNFSHSGTLSYSYDFDYGPSRNNMTNPAYGKAIHAPFTGVVTDVRQGIPDFTNNSSSNSTNNGGLGNTVQLSVVAPDGRSYFVRFAHLQNGSIPATLRVGDTVGQGALIGRIGQTGYSTTPHLHMHVSTTSTGRSVAFDFVEGPLASDEWATSQLVPNRFVVDNTGRASLGFPVRSVTANRGGTWTTYAWVARAIGTNYLGSTTSGAWFRWNFSYTVPARSSVRLQVYARCPAISSHDRAASYTLASSNTTATSRTTHDQRSISHSGGYLGTATLSAGTRTLTVTANRSSSGRLCADGLLFIRL